MRGCRCSAIPARSLKSSDSDRRSTDRLAACRRANLTDARAPERLARLAKFARRPQVDLSLGRARGRAFCFANCDSIFANCKAPRSLSASLGYPTKKCVSLAKEVYFLRDNENTGLGMGIGRCSTGACRVGAVARSEAIPCGAQRPLGNARLASRCIEWAFI